MGAHDLKVLAADVGLHYIDYWPSSTSRDENRTSSFSWPHINLRGDVLWAKPP